MLPTVVDFMGNWPNIVETIEILQIVWFKHEDIDHL